MTNNNHQICRPESQPQNLQNIQSQSKDMNMEKKDDREINQENQDTHKNKNRNGETCVEQVQNQGQSSPPRMYFDKDGRPLFGYPGPPSGFAYAKPWPPTPTNLGKKQVLRTSPDKLEKFLPSHDKNLFEPTPRPVSEIDLALKWDLAPYYNFRPMPQYMSCPVHGHMRARSVGSASTVASSSGEHEDESAPHRMTKSASPSSVSERDRDRNREKNLKSTLSTFNLPTQDKEDKDSKDKDKIPIKKREEIQFQEASKKTNGSINSDVDNNKENKIQWQKDENNKKKKNTPIYLVDEGVNTDPVEISPKPQKSEEETKGEKDKISSQSSSSCVVGNPPMRVSNNVTRATKCVGVDEGELAKVPLYLKGPTFLCPLHGSYRLGMKRRNNPKFRTVVLKKDSQVQTDLQIRESAPDWCRYKHQSRKPPVPRQERIQYGRQPTVKQEVKRQTVTNHELAAIGHSPQQNGSKSNCKSRRNHKDGVISEYSENFKNPIIVAESKKKNRSVHTCALSNRSFNNHLR